MTTPVYQMSKRELDRRLLHLTGPMFVGLGMIAFVNVVDGYVLGLLGTRELSASGACLPLVVLLQALTIGLSSGLAARIAMTYGRGEHTRAYVLTGQGMLMAVLFGTVIWLLGAALEVLLLPRLARDPAQLELARAYFFPMRCSVFVLAIPLAGTFACRGLGSTTPSAKVLTLAAVCNLLLAPALVFGFGPLPRLGMAGAGWGTALANVIAALYTLQLLREPLRLLTLSELPERLWEVLAIGLPTAAAQALRSLSTTVLIGFASRLGLECVAATSLIGRVESFVVMLPMAVAAAAQPLIGQLWGAGRVEAAREVLATARRIACAWSLCVGALLLACSGPVARTFGDDVRVRALLQTGLRFAPFVYLASSLIVTSGAALVAVGKAAPGMRITALFSLVLLPAAIGTLVSPWGATGVFAGHALAVGAAAAIYHRAASAEGLIAPRPPAAAAAAR